MNKGGRTRRGVARGVVTIESLDPVPTPIQKEYNIIHTRMHTLIHMYIITISYTVYNLSL